MRFYIERNTIKMVFISADTSSNKNRRSVVKQGEEVGKKSMQSNSIDHEL